MNEARRSRKTEWQRERRRAFKAAYGFSSTSHYGAGGNRESVLKRDGYACVRCGMTDAQHKARWNRPITIDHKSKDRSDNSMENLQTLCLTCHGRKDLIPRLRERKAAVHLEAMRALRAAGKSYQAIAGELGLSIATVWKYLRRAG